MVKNCVSFLSTAADTEPVLLPGGIACGPGHHCCCTGPHNVEQVKPGNIPSASVSKITTHDQNQRTKDTSRSR